MPRQTPSQHVFLIGFPRSGTTLLENILVGHPDIVALQEKNLLSPAAGEFLSSDTGRKRLAAASDAELEPHRVRYWQAVKSYGADVAGKIFIDNHHLNATKFLTVPKLFPEARVIFAIRDPRDVVLSCFRLDFVMNPSTFELLTLERAARYYDSVMSLSRNYRRMFTLPWLDVRHETLVGDFKSEVERLCAFLDIEPHPAMENFAERARGRAISTASANQVRRGLNADGIGTWRHYREELAPVLPLLAPWVEAFGYPAD